MARQARTESRERQETARARRVPLGTPEMKLTAENREGYVRRWFNGKGNRLSRAQQAGYTFVEDDTFIGEGAESRNSDIGSAVSQIVGTNEDGSPLRAYLMEIRREWYEEDQAAKQAAIDEREDAIRNGSVNDEQGRQDNRYVPREGIKFQ